MGFGGNEMRVGFSRRIMGSIHARNNPGMLRPDHAVRLNTRMAMDTAQGEHQGMPYGGHGSPGDVSSHPRGGSLRGAKSMADSVAAAGDKWVSMKDARAASSRLDPNRPSRRDVRNAYLDYKELNRFSGLASESYGMTEHTSADGPPGATGTSTMNQNTLGNTPGPVMKKALPAARAAGKAVGKRKAAKASKKAASKGDSFSEPDGPY